MNVATRTLTAWDIFTKVEVTPLREIWSLILALAFVLVTALSLIYVKDLNRQLYSELENFTQTQEELKIQKDQLLLEENTWAAQARVREIARDRLNMVLPDQSSPVAISRSF